MEGERQIMEMNRIEGGRIHGRPPTPQAAPKTAPERAAQKPAAQGEDQIEFSQKARNVAEGASSKPTRDELIEAARAKLESGELSTPEAYERTARKILKSGILNKPAE